jgi:hypothetical protein
MALPNHMSLRPDLLWLTLNLAMIIQCVSWNNIYIFLIYVPPVPGVFPALSTELEPRTFVARITPSYLVPLHFPSWPEFTSYLRMIVELTLNLAAYK